MRISPGGTEERICVWVSEMQTRRMGEEGEA